MYILSEVTGFIWASSGEEIKILSESRVSKKSMWRPSNKMQQEMMVQIQKVTKNHRNNSFIYVGATKKSVSEASLSFISSNGKNDFFSGFISGSKMAIRKALMTDICLFEKTPLQPSSSEENISR
jgi:hypothetical protein